MNNQSNQFPFPKFYNDLLIHKTYENKLQVTHKINVC